MHSLIILPLAEADLLGIWEYSYGKWGTHQADEYLLQLHAGLKTLSTNPRLGKSRESLREHYRSLQINHHVAFYRLTPDRVEIVRVLHELRDEIDPVDSQINSSGVALVLLSWRLQHAPPASGHCSPKSWRVFRRSPHTLPPERT